MAADVEAKSSHSNNTEEGDGDEDDDGNGGDGGDEEKEDEDDDNAVDLKQLDFSSQMVNLGPGALLKGTKCWHLFDDNEDIQYLQDATFQCNGHYAPTLSLSIACNIVQCDLHRIILSFSRS